MEFELKSLDRFWDATGAVKCPSVVYSNLPTRNAPELVACCTLSCRTCPRREINRRVGWKGQQWGSFWGMQ